MSGRRCGNMSVLSARRISRLGGQLRGLWSARRSVSGSGDEMNVVGDDHDRVDPAEWERPEMRTALWGRDITTVDRLLQKLGFSQQRIAALAGQSQPEVSAVIHGRQVRAYDVLSRIADGLGIPRGYMGLAYTEEPGQGRPASTAPMGAGPGRTRAGGGATSNGVG